MSTIKHIKFKEYDTVKEPDGKLLKFNDDNSITVDLGSVDPVECGRRLFYRKSCTLKPGVTILVGCNGSGKTSLIHSLEGTISIFSTYADYSDTSDGRSSAREMFAFYNNLEAVATSMMSSEGENVSINLIHAIHTIKQYIAENHEIFKKFYIFLDGIDSGTDIETIDFIKDTIFKDLISVFDAYGITLYIVASANNYELVRDMDCMEVYSGKYRRFSDYEEYRNYILKTYQYKIK